VVARGFDIRFVQLTAEGKDKLYDVIVLYYRRREPSKRDLRLFGVGLMLDLKRTTDEIRLGLTRLERARAMSTEDPGIRYGEPCIRESRIGVYEMPACSNRIRPRTRF
jgi:hypothetical protein